MTGRRLIVEADGGSRGNPGPAGYGALVKDAATGAVLVEIGEAIGVATNNVAEYRGLLAGLAAAIELDAEAGLEVRMDSKLVVEQMSGRWQVKHDDMRALVKQARALLRPGQARFTWIPRAQNSHADRLANEAMDDAAAGKPWRGSAAPAPRQSEPTADRFGAHQDEWLAYQATPWGRLRYRVVAHVLDRVCRDLQTATGRSGLRVLDVGGGDGGDAVTLASAGHDVTIVDISPGLLARAGHRARRAGVSVHLVEADLDTLGAGDYDLVLCHFVVQYRDDLLATIGLLARLVAPSGTLSIAAPNPPSEVLVEMTRHQDPVAALAALDAPTGRAVAFDAEVHRVLAEDVIVALRHNGFDSIRRFGIRCVSDYLSEDSRKEEPEVFAALERLELALHDREPYLSLARIWQLVATRG